MCSTALRNGTPSGFASPASHFGLWARAEEAARAALRPCPPAQPKPEETNAAFVVCAWPPGNEVPPHPEGRETAPAAHGIQAPRAGSGSVAPIPCQQKGTEHGARPGMACASQPPGKGHFPSPLPGEQAQRRCLWPIGQAGLFSLPAALPVALTRRRSCLLGCSLASSPSCWRQCFRRLSSAFAEPLPPSL